MYRDYARSSLSLKIVRTAMVTTGKGKRGL
jgi:hypothetical protein